MIRTLIEVTGENHWKFDENLKAALDKLGYEPKPSAENTSYMSHLWAALDKRGINPGELVKEYRDRMDRIASGDEV